MLLIKEPTMTSPATTLYELRQGAAWITLNRPEQRNALSAALVNALYDDLARALADPDARDRKSTRLNSSHERRSRMPSSA